jgi:hypothetical protein
MRTTCVGTVLMPVSVRKLAPAAVVALAASMAATGCRGSIAGEWRLVEAQPSREVFCLDDVSFGRDGGFSAVCTLDGRTAREVGAFDFNGFKLVLRPQAGGARSYNASLRFNTLEIIDGKRKVVLRKGP